uniref:Reverse transcriptase Ty1/copia-type domain-containing protein n=1 Tax=Vitis vinifera TaxID=29760 RepID=A5BVR3_VITVI|nr:hypothetical protein VITISV_033188 [Vitis vinifera]
MDVTFLESKMFYHPPNSSLQEKTHDEELNWFKDIPDIPLTIEPPMLTTETSNSISETPPHSTIPYDPTSKNILEVSSPLVTKHLTKYGYPLPPRHNRGKPPERYSLDIETHRSKYPIVNYVSTKKLSKLLKSFSNALSTHHIPTSVEETLQDLKWVQVMKEQMEALLKNKTWILVSLPECHKIVGCKWTYGVDYMETFSPVAKLNTVRVLLSLAANLDWPLLQFDVKIPFFHGDLDEEIYMDIPPGYIETSGKMVCKLQCTLYGLKQSPRAWFGHLNLAMRKYGFQ